MLYHPHEKRLYKQVAIHVHVESRQLNIREKLTAPLPDGATVILILEDGYQTDWEELT
jgi:hypothetical protein